jgi:uncharacterized protein YcbK (DUF882 family)
MTNPMIKIHNVETGEIIEREMNDAELAQHESDKLAHLARKAAETTKETQKAALLEKLGITLDEAKLLLS